MIDEIIERETHWFVFIIFTLIIIVFIIWKHKDELSEPQIRTLGFLVVIIVMIVLSTWKTISDYRFGKNSVISEGIIYAMMSGSHPKNSSRKITELRYKYEVNGIIYNGSSEREGTSDSYKHLKNKKRPIIYDPSNPEESYLLLSLYDYNKFGITIVDSIKDAK